MTDGPIASIQTCEYVLETVEFVDGSYAPGDELAVVDYGPDKGKFCHRETADDAAVGLVSDGVVVDKKTGQKRLRFWPVYIPMWATEPKKWTFYVLKCGDGSFYAGITVDVVRRIRLHQRGKGAKSLRPKKKHPMRLVYAEDYAKKSSALKREAAFKKLTHKKKAAIAKQGVWKEWP